MIDVRPLMNLPPITIRPYRHDDYDHAYRVVREIGTSQLGRNLRAWDEVFMDLSSFMWVASVEDRPIAFAGMSLPSNGLIYLHTDLVSPAFQRRGVGTALTLTRIAASSEAETDRIGVLATELSASFYSRFGFKEEAHPELDPFTGFRIHRMSMPYTSVLGQTANSLLIGLENLSLDTSTEPDPFEDEDTGQ